MKKLLEQLQKLWGLQPLERRVFAQAWLLFVVMDLGLRWMSFTALLRLLRSCRRGRTIDQQRLDPPLPRLIWLVESAGRYVPVSSTCLKQALVLSWLLGRRGIPTTIQIGVNSREGVLRAHAWLEHQGTVIFGHDESERFIPLLPARLPETEKLA